MHGEVVLDTSIIIPYLKGEVTLRGHFLAASMIFLPQIVLGELYYGAFLCGDSAKGIRQIQTFLRAVVLLPGGAGTAEYYGRTRAQLAQAGTPIPENDVWIAALALEHGLPLVTRDAHFGRVHGLNLLKW